MKFNIISTIEILERTPKVLKTMLYELEEGWTTNNEGGESWSAYDIIGHLIHGEKTDWIPRLNIILTKGTSITFEPFNRFAQFEQSKGKSLEQLLNEFEQLRENSIRALKEKELTAKQLSLKGIHPALGEVTLQHLLSAWTVHDLGHISQAARVMAKQYKTEVGVWREYLGVLHK